MADEPAELDDSLVGSSIYMRWEEYGWQLGKIADTVTNATPRLVKKFELPHHVGGRALFSLLSRAQGPRQACCRQPYGYGAHAAYNSWVILQQKA